MAVSMCKFKDAQSVEEVAEILKAEGQDEAKAERAWRELTYQREHPSEELSEEAGVPFTLEEGKALATGGELSDDELAAVSGGNPCFIFGGGNGVEAHCEGGFGVACAYLGVSFC